MAAHSLKLTDFVNTYKNANNKEQEAVAILEAFRQSAEEQNLRLFENRRELLKEVADVATKEDLKVIKDDLWNVKDDLKNVKDDLRSVKDGLRSVKDDLKNVKDELKIDIERVREDLNGVKESLKNCATKDDLKSFATKQELNALELRMVELISKSKWQVVGVILVSLIMPMVLRHYFSL